MDCNYEETGGQQDVTEIEYSIKEMCKSFKCVDWLCVGVGVIQACRIVTLGLHIQRRVIGSIEDTEVMMRRFLQPVTIIFHYGWK